MRRALLLLFIVLLTGQLSIAQDTPSAYHHKKFSADTVKHTINALTKELKMKHPGFYRYNSKDIFDRFIDSVRSTIKDSLTELEVFLKLKPIISKINCLHTGISISQGYREHLNKQPNLFPFRLYFTGNKTYIVKNYSFEKLILPGDEIISINGKRMEEIVASLLPLIPADGYNLTMKYKALNHQFPSWYRYIDLTEDFTIVVMRNAVERSYRVKGAKFDDIAEEGFLKEPTITKQLEFKIENNTGILAIHSFAESDIKASKQNFRSFIDRAFAELKQNNIQNLIVDLRDNTGGSDAYAAYFIRHFFDKPFRYWDRIEVTESIAKEIKGIMLKAFYRKPIQKDSAWLWQKARHVRDFDFYEEQQPAKNNFTGKTYVLINGFCMSSCADVTAVLSHNSKAVFIGQETGGGYQGNTSGMMPKTNVMPFNFSLTVPLQKFFNAVDPLKNIGRGTLPDFPIDLAIQEILSNKDKEMDLAFDLIKRSSN